MVACAPAPQPAAYRRRRPEDTLLYPCVREHLLAFRCKGRGICPSCIARRASDTAAPRVDRVFPDVPVRQVVLSVPVPLRYLLAWDTERGTAVVGIFVNAAFRHLRRVAKRNQKVEWCTRPERIEAVLRGGAGPPSAHGASP